MIKSTKSLFIALMALLLMSLIAGASIGWGLYREQKKTERLELALQIWQNCPLPPKGAYLVIESDWEGKAPEDEMRCFHARKPGPRNMRPSVEVKPFDNRCRGGLCV